MRATLLLAAALALVACSKESKDAGKGDTAAKPSDPAGTAAPAGGTRAKILDAWKTGGLSPSPLTTSTAAVGKDCLSGTVGGIDVLLCEFASTADAKAAEPAGYTWVGETTGSVQVSGNVLISIADRRKSDPSGRTINQMMKLAPK